MAVFDFVSFIIGLLLGAIFMLLFVWIAYYSRTFLFTYCPTQARACGGADYYNDPGDALANYPQLSVQDMLFIENGILYYKRPPQTTNCFVQTQAQTVQILYPQYCEFTNINGTSSIWKETSFNSNMYTNVNFGSVVETNGNCDPISTPSNQFSGGVPVVQWDTNPI